MKIAAIKVNQWLKDWDDVQFDSKKRRKPEPHFYMFSIKASLLKRLSKVYPRRANEKRDVEVGIQRKHDPERSEKIRQYVFGGFPWSELSTSKQSSDEFSDLKMPGWLPTAIIANILSPNTRRGNKTINSGHVIRIKDGAICELIIPDAAEGSSWDPDVPPLEIIDGQHRLWAFLRDEKLKGDFELPVVAFYDLDISWQAYLFYTINIKPKKINASLAFDLYPILRVQDWLERSPEGALIYKETRAQELVEVLWSHEKSPWKDRINMLGETRTKSTITQAAFIRSLLASLIKTATTKNLGGLFGSFLPDGSPLVWDRTKQAAFLIFIWQLMAEAVASTRAEWAVNLRKLYKEDPTLFDEIDDQDFAFTSALSLIATDQGVRGFLHIINDMVFLQSESLDINSIGSSDERISETSIDPAEVSKYLNQFKRSKLNGYIEDICKELVKFDWRTASTPGLSESHRKAQMVFKGSSGYKEIRSQLLEILVSASNRRIKEVAIVIQEELGYVNS
ncbi:MAG TPA: DGQHR domain-containing protein [Cyclobacteriaceae bacterium]|nr:DGQHR domain-containing protein [Cyclobacteriaceae bacterium]